MSAFISLLLCVCIGSTGAGGGGQAEAGQGIDVPLEEVRLMFDHCVFQVCY